MWLKNFEVTNFDIINNKCRRNKMKDSVQNYKIVKKKDFLLYSEKKTIAVSAAARRGTKYLWAKMDLIQEHFKSFKESCFLAKDKHRMGKWKNLIVLHKIIIMKIKKINIVHTLFQQENLQFGSFMKGQQVHFYIFKGRKIGGSWLESFCSLKTKACPVRRKLCF